MSLLRCPGPFTRALACALAWRAVGGFGGSRRGARGSRHPALLWPWAPRWGLSRRRALRRCPVPWVCPSGAGTQFLCVRSVWSACVVSSSSLVFFLSCGVCLFPSLAPGRDGASPGAGATLLRAGVVGPPGFSFAGPPPLGHAALWRGWAQARCLRSFLRGFPGSAGARGFLALVACLVSCCPCQPGAWVSPGALVLLPRGRARNFPLVQSPLRCRSHV